MEQTVTSASAGKPAAAHTKKITSVEDILKSAEVDLTEAKKALAGLKLSFSEKYPANYADKALAGKPMHKNGIPDAVLERWGDKYILGHSRAIVLAIARDLAK